MGRKGYSYQEVKDYIESFGYTLLSEHYINNREKVFNNIENFVLEV